MPSCGRLILWKRQLDLVTGVLKGIVGPETGCGCFSVDYELNMSVHPTAQIIDASSTSPHGPTDNRLTPIPEAQAIPNIVVTEDDSSTHQDDQEETRLAYVRSLLTKHS